MAFCSKQLTFTVTFKGFSQSSMSFLAELYDVAVKLIFRLRLIDSKFIQEYGIKAEVLTKMMPVVHGKET
jgi:hypothetical protein